jgi:uncharacterized OB-fold protein
MESTGGTSAREGAVSDGGSPLTAFRDGLAAGELRFQRCKGCDAAVFYPRVACPVCGCAELGWEVSAGAGAVYSTTTIPVRDGDPYNVTLVDLDEGIRIMTRVAGTRENAVPIGARGRLAITNAEDGPPTLFILDGGEE